MTTPATNQSPWLPKNTPRGDAGAAGSAPAEPAGGLELDAAQERYFVQFSRRAMACEFELTLNAGQFRQAATEALAVLDLVDALEAQLSVYREDSELSQLNRRAAVEPVQVEPRLFALLEYCQRLSCETRRAFDITSGPLTKVWGFFRRQGAIPHHTELAEALARVGSDKLLLDRQHQSVRFAVPGMELNLGSIGKGYALDRCAEQLQRAGFTDYLLHGGRSSILAKGIPSQGTPGAGWRVGIEHPLRPGKRLAEIRVRDAAVGTSAATNQYFRHQGKRYGHLLDPRTGQPVEGVYSTTVVASTAAEADALATALYVLGPHEAEAFCGQRQGLAMLMVYADRDGRPEIKTLGFAERDVTILCPV